VKSWSTFLLGRPLRTEEEQVEKIGPMAGLAVLGLDALASASYGPEAMLTVLIPLGAGAAGLILPLSGCILGVLFAVFLSYCQTIPAYPDGGGSFRVAKENLGTLPGLLAASALILDYVLNVAVAISAGVGALVSALPVLLPVTLPLCMTLLVLLALINLRGIRTTGLILMLPAYLFIACLGAVILIGTVKIMLADGAPLPVIAAPPPPAAAGLGALTFWLLLRSFASGCTALTGIEAVSNAVPLFRPPSVVLARRTLTLVAGILAFLLAGIAFVAHGYGLAATPPGREGYQSILSQMIAAVTGRGPFYFTAMTALLLVLALSANTSFADFPRVCRLLALDEFLPAEFAHRGSRLVYTAGIVVLTLLSGALLLLFGGITDHLIPLFAVGAFGAFTLSQAGMVVHWHRNRTPGWRWSLALNLGGAIATGATLLIIGFSKFHQGAWITLLAVPALVSLFCLMRRYHVGIDRKIMDGGHLDLGGIEAPLIIIPVKRLDRVARKALRIALPLSSEIHVVQILAEELQLEDLRPSWAEWVENPARAVGYRPPRLVVISSAYRQYLDPLLAYIRKMARASPTRPIAVMIPELVERRWYHFFLRRRALLLKALLLMTGGTQIITISTPWYLREERK
jgi:amino acid transporter